MVHYSRRSFTLIEILIAFSLMAVVAGGIVLGVSRSVRSTQLKASKERIGRMLLQAFRFSAISGHVGDVVVSFHDNYEGGSWEGYVNLWEINSRNLCLLAQKCSAIGRLSGIKEIRLNGCEVHRVIFRFFGGHGLRAVYAFDRYHQELAPSDFSFSSEAITHRERELKITLKSSQEACSSEILSLNKYLASVAYYLPFPDEYLSFAAS